MNLRRLIFPLLKSFNFDIKIRHHHTSRNFVLKLWEHKGYWYHGKTREADEICQFRRLIHPGDNVLEVGAHIGYLSQIFEEIIGSDGNLTVVEPTSYTREFLSRNIRNNTRVIPFALSDNIGTSRFYTEGFGGFTNSLDEAYVSEKIEIFAETQVLADKRYQEEEIQTTTVDHLAMELDQNFHFIKIDVEGHELQVLQGAETVLSKCSALMVEISKNTEEIYNLMFKNGFHAQTPNGKKIDDSLCNGNIFFVKNIITEENND